MATAARSGAATDGPALVLAHGLLGWGTKAAGRFVSGWTYFHEVEKYLHTLGIRTLCPPLGAGAPEERAQRLVEQIAAWPERRQGERVTIVGHSQGGLDARWAVSQLDAAGLARQVITLGTPHRGSTLCDEVVTPALSSMPTLEKMLKRANIQTAAATFLSRQYVVGQFNPGCPDSPDVAYYSLAGSHPSRLDYWTPFLATHALLQRLEGENDGLVSVESAKWGEFVGVVRLDHIEMINYPLKLRRASPWTMWHKVAEISFGNYCGRGPYGQQK